MQKKILAFFFASMACAFLLAETTYDSGRYSFSYPEAFTGIEETAKSFNALWNGFNAIFRFNPEQGDSLNRVVILADKTAYDAYIQERIGETRSQYLFLKYSKPELSELVLYPQDSLSGYAAFAGPSLNRQLFLQYLYSYVSEPPLWIRDGFQAFFENVSYDARSDVLSTGSVSPWLETAKNCAKDNTRRLGSEAIITATLGDYETARFYPQAWSLASFFVTTENPEYQRFIHEACILLAADGSYNVKTQKENTLAISGRFTRFYSGEKTDADFSVWLAGQHTFNDLVQMGVTSYNEGQFTQAGKTLREALEIRGEDPLVCYYLGLVAYSEKDYGTADQWYRKALEAGGETATIHWALGLSAYADKRYAESRVYLDTAKSANPARYGAKAAELINSLPK